MPTSSNPSCSKLSRMNSAASRAPADPKLRSPGADSRVRQNLALVVGLQGRFAEAEQIARSELSSKQAEANIAYLRNMLSQQNSWAKLSDKNKKQNTN